MFRRNGIFFLFMFTLGYLCTQWEVMPYYLRHKGAKPYPLSVPELFFDLFLLCGLLSLIPQRVSRWVKALLYVILYAAALADMFCYERFQSTLTPTMLMLVGETTGQETREFFAGYLDWQILTSGVGWILLLMVVNVVVMAVFRWKVERLRVGNAFLLPLILLFLLSAIQCWDNKVATYRLFACDTIGEMEYEQTRKDHAHLYLPVFRLAFAVYANRLASHQLDQLLEASTQVQVDSCSHRVPDIVLVIGESYNKHHAQLYGYGKPTTPRQQALADEGSLVAFSDVVAPWNLTSFVFKYMLSLYAVGDSGTWCDYPLFPEVFRRAGYRVTFITNQFQSEAKEAVYDFSGGFFLNHPELSQRQFDARNTRLYPYDDGVLREYDRLAGSRADSANLVILHLMGSHMNYRSRYPQKSRRYFTPAMYDRPELDDRQKRILAEYDNSLHYNDSIVYAITRRFADRDAVVIYMPDHGEEIFWGGEPYVYGRLHSATVDYRLAHEEFEIPFWIWGSPRFVGSHPEEWKTIGQAKDRPMMTDVLPHLLLYLGGISTPLYRAEYNVLAPEYNMKRPRILKGETEYDKLIMDN